MNFDDACQFCICSDAICVLVREVGVQLVESELVYATLVHQDKFTVEIGLRVIHLDVGDDRFIILAQMPDNLDYVDDFPAHSV